MGQVAYRFVHGRFDAVWLKAGPQAGMSFVPWPLTSLPLEMIRTTRSYG